MYLPVINPVVKTFLRIWTIVLYLITAFCAFGGYFNPQYFTIPLIAVMILPYMVFLTLAVSIAWFICGKWITGGLGILTLFICWGSVSAAVPVRFPRNPKPGSETFTVMTWNFLHGWDQKLPPDSQYSRPDNKSVEFIMEKNPDIVCLQEVYDWHECEIPNLKGELLEDFKKQYPYAAQERSFDLIVLSKYPVKNIPIKEFQARYLPKNEITKDHTVMRYNFYTVTIDKQELLLITTHMNSPLLTDEERNVVTDIKSIDSVKSSAREFKGTILSKIKHSCLMNDSAINHLCRILEDYKGPVIICGDFNDVPASWGWRTMTRNGFRDAYSEVGFGHLITYNQHFFWLHLDQIFYRGPLRVLDIKKCRIKTSDHYPLISTFQFDNQDSQKIN